MKRWIKFDPWPVVGLLLIEAVFIMFLIMLWSLSDTMWKLIFRLGN